MPPLQFKTELHAHTSGISLCAKMNPSEVAELYIEAGYTSIVLTNHYVAYNFKSEHSFEKSIERYLAHIYEMREYAKGRLNVLAGAEIHNFQNCNDYLIYGIDEDFLRKHENLHLMKVEEISAVVRESGALMVQAHPCRDGMTVVNPSLLDGIEVFNGTPNKTHAPRNQLADAWAKQFGLIRTSGTDFHGNVSPDYDPIMGGILTDTPITTPTQLVNTLRSGSYSLICEGRTAMLSGMKTMPAKEN